MKKLLLLCLVVLTSICTVSAQKNVLIHISVENEQTGILESPLKHGLSTSDFNYELINQNTGYDHWSCFSDWMHQSEIAYMANLFCYGPYLEVYRCTVTVNKPGHKLNGRSDSFEFVMTTEGVDSFVMENGIVIESR